MSAEVGETVAYNNAAVMLLPAFVAAAVGQPFLDCVASEIFDPLHITTPAWATDRVGNTFGMSHLLRRALANTQAGLLRT